MDTDDGIILLLHERKTVGRQFIFWTLIDLNTFLNITGELKIRKLKEIISQWVEK
jgi:hypothetical protein